MELIWIILRVAITAAIIVAVAEISQKSPRGGALLLSLPIVSILAFLMSWFQHHNLTVISRMAKETLILVPLGLIFFVPLALAPRLGLGFWPTFLVGIALAALLLGGWYAFVSSR